MIYCYRLVMHGDGKGGISGASIFFGTEVGRVFTAEANMLTLCWILQFAILTCTALSIHAKYFINLVDIIKAGGRDDAPPWDGKSMWTFYVDLIYCTYPGKLIHGTG